MGRSTSYMNQTDSRHSGERMKTLIPRRELATCLMRIAKAFCVFAFALSLGCASRQGVVGAYRHCLMGCLTVQIRPDNTFTYHLDGDLYNDERATGTWSFAGDNKIRAVLPAAKLDVDERSLPGASGFRIRVTDQAGDTLPDAMVWVVVAPTSPLVVSTVDKDGWATLPRCDEFDVLWAHIRMRYKPRRVESNEFTVRVPLTGIMPQGFDGLLMIENDRLHFTKPDGSINRVAEPLTRLSVAEEKRIFP